MALDDDSGHNGSGGGGGEGGGGGRGDDQNKETSPSTANGGSGGGGPGLRSASKPNAGKKRIVLKSPMGGEPMVYDWPLKKGKGSVRKSEVRDQSVHVASSRPCFLAFGLYNSYRFELKISVTVYVHCYTKRQGRLAEVVQQISL